MEIIGPIFGDGVWKPLAEANEISYKVRKVRSLPGFLFQVNGMLKAITGNVTYASKPLFTSFGIGLLKKLAGRKPLVLDIDDWQSGLVKQNYRSMPVTHSLMYLAYSIFQLHSAASYWNSLFGEKLAHFADQITVSSSFLKEKFGGTIIWHARDTEAFNPEKFDSNSFRDKYGIERDKKIVMFLGTPRPHKGIEDLIQAVSLLGSRDVLLILVGRDEGSYTMNLMRLAVGTLGDRFRSFGLQPFEKVPEFLAMSDVIVIPQKSNLATIGQVPAKVFDAMAMAKPIIATAVGDLPEILDGCGYIVKSESHEQLAEAIQYIIANPNDAEQIGQKARQKCIANYSYDAMEKVMVNVFGKYE